jgi:hypothetical protein
MVIRGQAFLHDLDARKPAGTCQRWVVCCLFCTLILYGLLSVPSTGIPSRVLSTSADVQREPTIATCNGTIVAGPGAIS